MHDHVRSSFRNHPHFPQQFTVQFVHKDVEKYIDLDSPIQLLDRLSNNLLIIEDPSIKNDDREKVSDGDSSDVSKKVFCIFIKTYLTVSKVSQVLTVFGCQDHNSIR